MSSNHQLQCVSLLRACKTLSHLKQIHAYASKTGLESDSLIAAKLLLLSAVTLVNSLDYASRFFSHYRYPNTFMYNTLIRGFSESEHPQRSLLAFTQMRNQSVHPDSFSFAFLLKAAANFKSIYAGTQLHSLIINHGLDAHLFVGYSKAGEMELARKLFYKMSNKDPVSWSTMIVGFASNGQFEPAVCFFQDLLREGLRPNEVSLNGILSACAQSGAFETGKILHGRIAKAGLNGIVPIANALLDMYGRCGSIEMARMVFEREMRDRNIISWTSMIAALAMHGLGEEAIELFHKMEEFGARPDEITFISVLYACSHAGMVQQGEDFFQRMEGTYRIEPSVEHYGCLVDLYGRAGLLDKAYKFVIQMPIKPNAVIWRTLLGACSIHGNVRLAELVKQWLEGLDPNDSGDYVLLSNIYAVAGKWKDVAEVRKSMSKRCIKKDPGWSSIEVNKVVYGFMASDESSEESEEANKKLTEIMARLRMEGYVPEIGGVLHDIEEEEKEGALVRHSEKLAVAFGLGRMGEGSIIRIVKNLRVCRDCHKVMKMISKVYGREIVVRDRSRFHCFREGSCSCRDYW